MLLIMYGLSKAYEFIKADIPEDEQQKEENVS